MADPPIRYIQFLPAVYQPGGGAGDQAFLDSYLSILQNLLDRNAPVENETTTKTVNRRGMADVIDVLPQLFYPQLSFLFPPGDETFIPPLQPNPPPSTTYTDQLFDSLNDYFGIANPTDQGTWQTTVDTQVSAWLNELLDWQSTWISLACDNNWTLDSKREIMATILPVFRQRGTAAGLEELLNTFITGDIAVNDVVAAPAMTVGHNTQLKAAYASGDPVVGGVRPFAFQVVLTVPTYDIHSMPVLAKVAAIRALVDQEKPAHTSYTVDVRTTITKLGVNSVVGETFLLPIPADQ
jgi:phage tail-like protein